MDIKDITIHKAIYLFILPLLSLALFGSHRSVTQLKVVFHDEFPIKCKHCMDVEYIDQLTHVLIENLNLFPVCLSVWPLVRLFACQ